MNYIVEKKRLDWIDALRALAIFLVILGHCAPNCYTYFLFTSPLKMPLFFVITGFVFNPINVNSAFYKKNISENNFSLAYFRTTSNSSFGTY